MKRLLAPVILSLGLFSASASANVIPFSATLSGSQETPPNASPATGSATLAFDDVSHVLSWTIDFSGLTAAATAAHFHGRKTLIPSGPGIASPVQFAIPGIIGFSSGTASGSFDFDSLSIGAAELTLAQRIADLQNNLWYINIHNSTFPGGEIRGQVIRAALVPEPATAFLLGLGLLGFAWMRRTRGASHRAIG